VETLLARALELGAEKAKAIDPASVVIDEWVVWKCQYGCALFHRDSCHPPDAPSPERTRKPLGSERLTGATLDRLTHRCQIIETKGESYRLRDATTKLRKGSAGSAGSKGPRRKALEGGQTSS